MCFSLANPILSFFILIKEHSKQKEKCGQMKGLKYAILPSSWSFPSLHCHFWAFLFFIHSVLAHFWASFFPPPLSRVCDALVFLHPFPCLLLSVSPYWPSWMSARLHSSSETLGLCRKTRKDSPCCGSWCWNAELPSLVPLLFTPTLTKHASLNSEKSQWAANY